MVIQQKKNLNNKEVTLKNKNYNNKEIDTLKFNKNKPWKNNNKNFIFNKNKPWKNNNKNFIFNKNKPWKNKTLIKNKNLKKQPIKKKIKLLGNALKMFNRKLLVKKAAFKLKLDLKKKNIFDPYTKYNKRFLGFRRRAKQRHFRRMFFRNRFKKKYKKQLYFNIIKPLINFKNIKHYNALLFFNLKYFKRLFFLHRRNAFRYYKKHRRWVKKHKKYVYKLNLKYNDKVYFKPVTYFYHKYNITRYKKIVYLTKPIKKGIRRRRRKKLYKKIKIITLRKITKFDKLNIVSYLINNLYGKGNKKKAYNIILNVFLLLKYKYKTTIYNYLEKAIDNVKPLVHFRTMYIGGKKYKIPVLLSNKKSLLFGLRWLIYSSKENKKQNISLSLMKEIVDSSQNDSSSVKKRKEQHLLAFENKSYIRFLRFLKT